MSRRRIESKESRTRLTLRKELLRNMSVQQLSGVHGGLDVDVLQYVVTKWCLGPCKATDPG